MLVPTVLSEEVRRNGPAREAMDLIEAALARRTPAERRAFWYAIDLAYVSRKAPDKPTAPAEAEIATQAIAAMA